MRKVFIAIILTLTFTFAAYAQCPLGSVCVGQATVDKCSSVADQLLAARDLIAKYQVQEGASNAERAAATKLVEGLNALVATKDRIEAEQNTIIQLYKDVVLMQQGLIEKLTKRLDAPRSAFSKFMDALKTIGYILAGAALRGL